MNLLSPQPRLIYNLLIFERPPEKQTELNTKYANYVNKPPKIKEAELWWASNEFMNDFMPTSADQLAFNAKYQGDERIF